jgi:acetyl esterase/lipase
MRHFYLLGLFFTVIAWAPPADVRAGDANYSRKEVIYARKYGTALTMDIFSPKLKANGAGVIFAVSGGWFSNHSSITGNIPLFIQPLVDKGYTVFAVVHGSSPKYALPEILEDMHRSVRFIRQNAKEYGVDPERLGITGGSAGGHLSLMQGCAGIDGNPKSPDPVDRRSSRVQAVVSFYPPTDFLNWGETGKVMLGTHPIVPVKGAFDFSRLNPKTVAFELVTDEKKRAEIGKEMSPIAHVAKNNPPTLIIHGDKDALVPIQQAQIMAAKLKEAGVTSELIVKKGGGHDAALVKEHTPHMIAWFDKYLLSGEPQAATSLQDLQVIPLWAGGAPGSEGKTSAEITKGVAPRRAVSNVHNPSLTVFLPPKEKANGAAVIVCPGGGWRVLMIDYEGYDVARYLANHGIAAFVLKYRLIGGESDYKVNVHALADTQRAVQLVRSRAQEWNIDPARVGMVGFSAGGGMVNLASARFKEGQPDATDPVEHFNSRPSFQGLIYAAVKEPNVIKGTPPAFLAVAADDKLASGSIAHYQALRKAGVPAELHIYERGGHGFLQPGPAQTWNARFVDWMDVRGYLQAKK